MYATYIKQEKKRTIHDRVRKTAWSNVQSRLGFHNQTRKITVTSAKIFSHLGNPSSSCCWEFFVPSRGRMTFWVLVYSWQNRRRGEGNVLHLHLHLTSPSYSGKGLLFLNTKEQCCFHLASKMLKFQSQDRILFVEIKIHYCVCTLTKTHHLWSEI